MKSQSLGTQFAKKVTSGFLLVAAATFFTNMSSSYTTHAKATPWLVKEATTPAVPDCC